MGNTRMKKTAYIHLGLPKTGTTAMQTVLQNLFDQGMLDKYDMQFHHKSTWLYLFDYWVNQDLEYFVKKVHEDIERFGSVGEKNIIFSNECLTVSAMNQYNAISDVMLDAISYAFSLYDIKIIIYLRRQDILFESMAMQNIKMALGCENVFEMYKETKFDFKDILDSCAEKFGKENVIVRVYDRETLYNNDSTSDFLHILGLDEYIYSDAVKISANPSFSPRNIRIAMADNLQYLLDAKQIHKRLVEVKDAFEQGFLSREQYSNLSYKLNGGKDEQFLASTVIAKRTELLSGQSSKTYGNGGKGYLTLEQRIKILDTYAVSNAAVAREYLGREDGILFKNTMPTTIVDIAPPSIIDILELFEPILLEQYDRLDEVENKVMKYFDIVEKNSNAQFEAIEKALEKHFTILENKVSAQEHKCTLHDAWFRSITKPFDNIKINILKVRNVLKRLSV